VHVQYRISGYNKKAEHVLCELIIGAAKLKNLDATVYPEDFACAAPANNIEEKKRK
jgi:hypothetical protein